MNISKYYYSFSIENGSDPNPDTEYIYIHNLAWKKTDGKYPELGNIKYGTIVINVEKLIQTDGSQIGYNFVVKSTGENLHCSYGWAFVENTNENIALLKEMIENKKLISSLEKRNLDISKLITLRKK